MVLSSLPPVFRFDRERDELRVRATTRTRGGDRSGIREDARVQRGGARTRS